MSIFLLKIIAVFFMVVDHIKYSFSWAWNDFTLYFGRIAFPIFAFCAVQGYIHTRDLKKYIKRLLICGAVSEIPYLLFESLPILLVYNLNIMFTIALGLLAIKAYDVFDKKWKGILAVLIISILAQFGYVDYGAFGIWLIFSFYVFKDSKIKTFFASFIVISVKYLYRIYYSGNGFTKPYLMCWLCTSIPLFLILLYNGKKGPSIKWFFYIFYPLHLLILWILSPYTSLINT